MEITLEQLLKSRDQRWDRERRLLQEFPGQTLVVLTVVMPGRVKRNAHTRVIARAAEAAVQAFLGPKVVLRYTNDAPTGYEAYWIVRAEARSVKRQMCGIEDFHPLGRLFDLDVIQSDATPLSRTDVGFVPRRCLLCDKQAQICARSRRHSVSELTAKIAAMLSTYLN